VSSAQADSVDDYLQVAGDVCTEFSKGVTSSLGVTDLTGASSAADASNAAASAQQASATKSDTVSSACTFECSF
jgi:hypothetical protein